jgi:PAS domain S-box-containing protein
MIYLDLIINLSLLVALSVVSGFIDKRWPRQTRLGVLLQGALFGGASVIGMLHPLNLGHGLIFDGRSVLLSLSALFFGPWAASVAVLMTIPCRVGLGGAGMIMGVLVILSSAGIGLVVHYRLSTATQSLSTWKLYLFGLAVHLVMVALMFTLPGNIIMSTVERVGIPVILLYPLATILVGKVLSDQLSAIRYLEELRISEEKYKLVFEAANVGKSLTLPTGEINVNQTFCDILGYSKEELKNMRWQDLTPPGDIETTQKHIDLLLSDKKDSTRFNKRYISKNGSYIWADISVVMHRNIDRNPLFFITTIVDITERKQAEEALREKEQQLSLITDNIRDTLWLMDLGMRTTWISPSVFRTRGYTLAELAELPMDRHLASGSLARMTELSAVNLTPERFADPSTEISVSTELEYYRKDGSTFWADTFIILLRDNEGRPSGFLGVGKDITDRKVAEGKLQASEARLRAILDATPFPIAMVDVQDNIIEYWSSSALDLFGHTAPATTEWYQLAYPDPEYRSEVIDRWKPFLETARHSGKPVNTGEYRVSCHDGSVRICELYATFLSDKLIVTFNDITARKMIEKALITSEEQLREAHRLAHIGIWSWIAKTDTVTWSEDLYHIAGLDPLLPAPAFAEHDKIYAPESLILLKDAVGRALKTGETYQIELKLIRPDGTTRWTKAFGGPIYGSKGKITGLHGTLLDITDIKMADEEIRRLNESLERQVTERTAKLKETIALLEETNRAFIGRELRMVELKEQIAELEKRLQR